MAGREGSPGPLRGPHPGERKPTSLGIGFRVRVMQSDGPDRYDMCSYLGWLYCNRILHLTFSSFVEFGFVCCAKASLRRFPSSTFYPFHFRFSVFKLNSRKTGTLIVKGTLGNLGWCVYCVAWRCIIFFLGVPNPIQFRSNRISSTYVASAAGASIPCFIKRFSI